MPLNGQTAASQSPACLKKKYFSVSESTNLHPISLLVLAATNAANAEVSFHF